MFMDSVLFGGILALTDLADISADVYAWTAVLVLPINSALNPFLYTLPAIAGRKAQKKTQTGTKLARSNMMTFPKAEVDAWFRLFKKTRFFNERTDGFVPMATDLNEPTFNHRKCIQIVIGTLKCLFGLHARGLTQENMVFEDVFVKKRSAGFVVSLNCRPQAVMLKKKTKTADSIKCFGEIASALLDQCERKL